MSTDASGASAQPASNEQTPTATTGMAPHPTVQERAARGKAARDRAPRESHAAWKPAADRPRQRWRAGQWLCLGAKYPTNLPRTPFRLRPSIRCRGRTCRTVREMSNRSASKGEVQNRDRRWRRCCSRQQVWISCQRRRRAFRPDMRKKRRRHCMPDKAGAPSGLVSARCLPAGEGKCWRNSRW